MFDAGKTIMVKKLTIC